MTATGEVMGKKYEGTDEKIEHIEENTDKEILKDLKGDINDNKEEVKEISLSKETIEANQKFDEILNKISSSNAFQKFKEKSWDKFSQSDKEQLYSIGKPSMWNTIVQFGIWGKVKHLFQFDDLKLKFTGDMIAPLVRPLVQLDLLPIEGGKINIIEDAKRDKKNILFRLTLAKYIAEIMSPELIPEIEQLISVIKKMSKTQAELVEIRQFRKISEQKNSTKNIVDDADKDLSNDLSQQHSNSDKLEKGVKADISDDLVPLGVKNPQSSLRSTAPLKKEPNKD